MVLWGEYLDLVRQEDSLVQDSYLEYLVVVEAREVQVEERVATMESKRFVSSSCNVASSLDVRGQFVQQ